MRRREERQQERETFGRGGNAVHYKMRQSMVSIGDDFWIENDRGEKTYKVDGKALRVRKTLVFEDAHGKALAQIQERMLTIKDTMEIEGPNGEKMATVKKALITPVRERFSVQSADGSEMDVQGNFVDHEYAFEAHGQKVGEVSKKWFRIADSYGVEIAPGQNEMLILAASVCIDMIAHKGR